MVSKSVLSHRRAQSKYQATPHQKKVRASRNRARRLAIKMGIIKRKDKRDVDHKNSNPLDTRPGNIRAQSKHANRSFPRTRGAHEKRR
jgi:hypothetical protein